MHHKLKRFLLFKNSDRICSVSCSLYLDTSTTAQPTATILSLKKAVCSSETLVPTCQDYTVQQPRRLQSTHYLNTVICTDSVSSYSQFHLHWCAQFFQHYHILSYSKPSLCSHRLFAKQMGIQNIRLPTHCLVMYIMPPHSLLTVNLLTNSEQTIEICTGSSSNTCLTTHMLLSLHNWGMQWHSWLRHCTTSQKIAGSSPDGVTGINHWLNPSSCTVALGSIQPLTQMSTRYLLCYSLAHRADNLDTFKCWLSRTSGSLILLDPYGPVQDSFTFAQPSMEGRNNESTSERT
jgi:hypothetical protein